MGYIATKAQSSITYLTFTSSSNSLFFNDKELPLDFKTTFLYEEDSKKLKILRKTPVGETSELWDVTKISFSPDLQKDSVGEIRMEISSSGNLSPGNFLFIKITKDKNENKVFESNGLFLANKGEPGKYNFEVDKKTFFLKFSQKKFSL